MPYRDNVNLDVKELPAGAFILLQTSSHRARLLCTSLNGSETSNLFAFCDGITCMLHTLPPLDCPEATTLECRQRCKDRFEQPPELLCGNAHCYHSDAKLRSFYRYALNARAVRILGPRNARTGPRRFLAFSTCDSYLNYCWRHACTWRDRTFWHASAITGLGVYDVIDRTRRTKTTGHADGSMGIAARAYRAQQVR